MDTQKPCCAPDLPPSLEGLVDLVAQALARSIGHGMSEKCETHARAVLQALATHQLEERVGDPIIRAAQRVLTRFTPARETFVFSKRAALDGLAAALAGREKPEHAWDIQRAGDDLLICMGCHDKHDQCEHVRYSPEKSI